MDQLVVDENFVLVEEDFAQHANPVSTLRSIIDGYPLFAVFREIIQNSDDAGASKQTFVLDQRNHTIEGLYCDGLASAQGPAFLAFNDAVLSPRDWQALKSIHDSSKVQDESKIGKYGIGFRSLFNLTDSPQILSDNYLAISDPLRLHLDSEGKKIPLVNIVSACPNQLVPFDFFMKDGPSSHFPGTVIRCPLRNEPSRISEGVVRPQTISDLFQKFMEHELEISCLFLKNIKCIEIYEIDCNGVSSLLAKMAISRSAAGSKMVKATVELVRNQISETKEWHIIQSNFSRAEAADILLPQGYDLPTVTRILQGAKLSPDVKIAVDVTGPIRGRLFTYLPLPIFSKFPVHIHGLFGIDTSRAHLRRADIALMSGSQDHVKAQWNKMLFDTFIPRTWSSLLEEIASKGLVSDIFSFWPPAGSSGELECYHPLLCETLVTSLLTTNAAVWPTYAPQNQSTQFKSLDSLAVASPDERECVLQALAGVGISFTRPPKYIFDLLCNLPKSLSILSPELAHGLLLDKVDKITEASEKDQGLMLEYLLSTNNVLNVCDLPLIPVASGEKVKISNEPGVPVYTILTRSEFDVFGPCDASAIPYHRLPTQVAATLLELGPASVNVQRLAIPRIVEYLSGYSSRLYSQGKMDYSAVRWLSGFWEWMSQYGHQDELFPQVRHLPLLPSTHDLRTAESALFKPRGEYPAYTTAYRALGVPFLSLDLSEAAQGVLQHHGLAKSMRDIPALLDALDSITSPAARLSRPNCEDILKHLGSILDESVTQDRTESLRHLPIFPILTCTTSGNSLNVVTNWAAIPRGHAIRSVGRPKFVPSVDGILFVGLDNISPSLVKFLEPTHPNPMTENDLVELAVENLTTQPRHLQLAVVRHIMDNRTRTVQDVFNKLGRQSFVLAEDTFYHIPGDIVDPDSDVGPLYVGCSAHQPSRGNPFCVEILRCLRSLGLLRARLNSEIVSERIQFISSRNTSDETLPIARNLLQLLGSTNVDFSRVQGISEKKWLPTNRGLCSADECRHAAFTPRALFDRVLAILDPFKISPLLQTALRWDEPLGTNVLIRQLDCLLGSEHKYDVVVEVIQEFGRRQWTDEDFDCLKRTVGDRHWIPTATGDKLADVKSSVFNFSPMMIGSGFYQIKTDLKAEMLLRRMGCADFPTTEAIIDKLHSLHHDTTHADPVSTAVGLLRSLPDGLTTAQQDELLVPDKESRLRPFSKTFYNDIGEDYHLGNDDGHYIAHESLEESLVRKLGLNRLGLRYADLLNLGPDMGQAPITTVRRTLTQYSKQQFLLEFLANAEDANATEFTVAVNHITVGEDENLRVMSPALAYLRKLPSLVVHNNALFTPKDFEGIRLTNVGGKEGRSDTIGEFGLGVLTMYHFTDLAMVISGSSVLFMDPSKKHNLYRDRACIKLPLKEVQQNFKGHLVALDGLFGFDMSVESYDGTLFVLPLRQQSEDVITAEFWSPARILLEILDPFEKIAGDCLLFTHIQKIRCIIRAVGGDITQQWSFCAQKKAIVGSEAEYELTAVEITKSPNSLVHWVTVKTSRAKDQLPLEFQAEGSLTGKPSFAGLAARRDGASNGHFFSTLPLSTPTTLPMHVMASFKLSSDRRQIRLDGLEDLQRGYNTWLLKDVIPPLYLFFLEHLLRSKDEHYSLRWPSDKGDTLSNYVVNSFYSPKHLTSSPRELFTSLYSVNQGHLLTPKDAVLQVSEPHNIHRIIGLLAPHQVVGDLQSGPRELAARMAKLPTVDADFIRKEILRSPEAITSEGRFRTILDVMLYLTHQKDDSDILCGLPILPLEDGTFGTLDTRGKGTIYYLWRPKDNRTMHNFDKTRFVHPEMSTKDVEKFRLNFSLLDGPTIKRFVEEKISSFSEDGSDSSAQDRWTDSFWDSWEEYVPLGLKPKDIASFSLIPQPESALKFISLDQCKDGTVLLVDPATRGLHACLRQLGLPAVHIDSPGLNHAIRDILKDQDEYPRMKLENVLSAIRNTVGPIPDLFGSLDDELKEAFASWARTNITSNISGDQLALARTLPIWPSAGGGAPQALRPASEVQLLPENLALEDVAVFIVNRVVAEDASLTHLKVKRMTLDELSGDLQLPDVDEETLARYKKFYEKSTSNFPSSWHQTLPVPTSACTFKKPKDLFKREPLFTAVFPENSPFFVHPTFEEFEEKVRGFELKSQKDLDIEMFKTCARSLDANDPTAVPRAREVFLAFSEILPTRVKQHAWRELDDVAFIPRRMDTVRKLSDQDENEPGLEIPPVVTCLDAIVQPGEVAREEFEAIAWSQRACFEAPADPKLYEEYHDFGRPDISQVIAHLRYLSHLPSLCASQRRILLHDVEKVYQYLEKHVIYLSKENEELAQTILVTLRDEPLFLNIDDDDDDDETLNWVKGSSLIIGCHHREGCVRTFLRPFEDILVAAGAVKVHHLSYICMSFDQLRREKALTDVVFLVQPTEEVPNPENLFAHRSFLAVCSEYFKEYFCQTSQEACPGCPLTFKAPYSFQSVRSFLDFIYTRSMGEEAYSLELLLEILDLSNKYKVKDLFDEVQGEIIRRFLTPEAVDKIKDEAEKHQAKGLLKACMGFTRRATQMGDI